MPNPPFMDCKTEIEHCKNYIMICILITYTYICMQKFLTKSRKHIYTRNDLKNLQF